MCHRPEQLWHVSGILPPEVEDLPCCFLLYCVPFFNCFQMRFPAVVLKTCRFCSIKVIFLRNTSGNYLKTLANVFLLSHFCCILLIASEKNQISFYCKIRNHKQEEKWESSQWGCDLHWLIHSFPSCLNWLKVSCNFLMWLWKHLNEKFRLSNLSLNIRHTDQPMYICTEIKEL